MSYVNYDGSPTMKGIGVGCLLAFIAVIVFILILSIKTISPGEAAVSTRFGQLNGVRNEGTYLALFEGYTIYNLKTKRVDGKHQAGSKDGQFIYIDTAFSYNLKSDKLPQLYSQVGTQEDLEQKFIITVIRDIVYQVAAQYGTDEILIKQAEFRVKTLQVIKERMNQEYFNIGDLQVTDIDFSEGYNKVLEEKQIAEQNAVKERQVAEQNSEKKKIEIEQDLRQKNYELEAAKIDAEKQRLLQGTLTDALLRKQWIEKWDGKLPNTMTGSNSNLYLPIQ